jgi:aryl-alcohol dehydrogenase-like predicted oxidoreductase
LTLAYLGKFSGGVSMLSKIVLGTMRMASNVHQREHWDTLLGQAHSLGVRRLHCSDEYDSFPLLCDTLRKLRVDRPGIAFDIVAKLAEPGFGEQEFSESRFLRRLDDYRAQLQLDCIDTVQWMWRGTLDDHQNRCDAFRASAGKISDAIERAREAGLLRSVYCFPYHPSFALLALDSASQDGLALYRNPEETEYDILVDQCGHAGKGVMVIRPFSAGVSLRKSGPHSLIRYSATLRQVTGIVVSCSTIEHLQECVQAASPD